MTTITPKQQASIAATVERMQLASGLGDEENACSIAAINLALSGELTDRIPDCMSHVVGSWIIAIQDRMPNEMRNSNDWKRLLPLAAGTGRDHEPERLAMIIDWMWSALTLVQPVADAGGFGVQWAEMCSKRTTAAADYATATATATAYATTTAAALHATAAAATYATIAASCSTAATTFASDALKSLPHTSVRYAAMAASEAASWQAINPTALLEKLIRCS